MTNDKLAALVAAAKAFKDVEHRFKGDVLKGHYTEWRMANTNFRRLSTYSAILSLVARLREAEKLLLDLGPYMDSIICYASTCDEYEANRIARDARAYMEPAK